MTTIVIAETVSVEGVTDAVCARLPEEYHDSVIAAIMSVLHDKSINRHRRNREIVKQFGQGSTRRELCDRYELSWKQVCRVINYAQKIAKQQRDTARLKMSHRIA